MPPSAATSQYPLPSGVAAMPTIGLVEVRRAHGAVELGVAEGEDAAVERAQPVALGVRRGRHGHDRPLQRQVAGRALEAASPKAKTPPSALASKYPLPSGVATPEKTGEFRGWGIGGLVRPTLPKPIIPPSW